MTHSSHSPLRRQPESAKVAMSRAAMTSAPEPAVMFYGGAIWAIAVWVAFALA